MNEHRLYMHKYCIADINGVYDSEIKKKSQKLIRIVVNWICGIEQHCGVKFYRT